MPKTNKICLYFDKEELESITGWIDTYFLLNEDIERKKSQCENSENQESPPENCNCKACKSIDEHTEILSRIMKKINSRMSQ